MDENIYTALNKVMSEVGYVQKTKSGGVNYAFAGEAALIEAVRPHLVEAGIVVYPTNISNIHQDT